jgi:hypothetical protein
MPRQSDARLLNDNAAAFTALFDEFLAKARPLITECGTVDAFDAADAHDCLDEIDGFASTVLDHMRIGAMDADDAYAASARPLEPGETFRCRPTLHPYPNAAE